MTGKFAIGAGTLIAAMLAGTGYFILSARSAGDFGECATSTVAGSTIGGPFELTRHDGVRVTDKDVIDGPTLVYFGYTYCPDVCPVDTGKMAEVTEILDARGITVKPVMITIDPERDTPEVMQDYMSWLHPRMVGLTGSLDDVTVAAKAYKAYFRRAGNEEDYLMDHSAFTYLMAPDHGLLDFFRREVPVEQMADTVACFAEKLET